MKPTEFAPIQGPITINGTAQTGYYAGGHLNGERFMIVSPTLEELETVWEILRVLTPLPELDKSKTKKVVVGEFSKIVRNRR